MQRGEDPERRHQRAAAEVGDLPGRRHRRPAGRAAQPQQAAAREVVHVVPRAVAVGPFLPVAGDRAVDEPGVLLAQALVADAEPVEHAGAERLEQHVVHAHEPQQHLPSRLRLEVEPDRALAAVEREEQRRGGARLHALVPGRRPADVVAEPRVLDLEHVGAVVGEQQRAVAAGQQPRQVQHPDPVQRSGHAAFSSGARLGDRRDPPAGVQGHPRGPLDEVAVGARHLAAGQVEVVLQPDAHGAAERQRRGDERPLLTRDPDQPPVAAGRDVVDHRGQVARGRRRAAEHSHHARHVQWRAQHALVHERLERADVAEVEALVLGLDAELVHRLEQGDDLLERVGEDHREHEVAPAARVLRVVHRAHVQRGDLRLERAQVGDPPVDGNPDRAGRVVHDDVDLGDDRLGDRAEVLDLVARTAVRRARVDVDHARAGVDRAARLGRVLSGRVRDRRALLAVRHGARDRACDQYGVVDCHGLLVNRARGSSGMPDTSNPAIKRKAPLKCSE